MLGELGEPKELFDKILTVRQALGPHVENTPSQPFKHKPCSVDVVLRHLNEIQIQ